MLNRKGNINIIILLVLVLIGVVAAYFLFPKAPVTPKTATSPANEAVASVPSDWKTRSLDESELRYPDYLTKFVSGKSFSLTTDSKTAMTAQYKKFAADGGCPSTCGQLASDPALLEKQFQLLAQAENLPNCLATSEFKDDVSKNFILMSGGIGSKFLVDTIKNGSGQCGIKLIQSSGFDVSLRNFYYTVGFLTGDKFLSLSAPIYPVNAFPEVDSFWKNLGYDFSTDSCSASCTDAQTKYFENFSVSDPLVKKVVSVYDQMVSTLITK